MLNDAEARVLTALREGAALVMHVRQTGRGPYYTLAGRRLSVVTLKGLEGRTLIAREGGGGHTRAAYVLTQAGAAALADWEQRRPPRPLLLP
ncbi:hypothetical protein DEIPH_ctg012orf0002 [Deinococcus phoenicis]|uniref:PadR family transcriptional regulator n=1 Tax=Deinococcus phoenicis TaxID=1476583 RepID=A0A016QSH1_9DEIO|nr:hypothetical protein [Deinococcus phoenicis]EYB68946.1 hypothetical protein DEIPH_ctg012orf0002 [Deinococcus phoenicis]